METFYYYIIVGRESLRLCLDAAAPASFPFLLLGWHCLKQRRKLRAYVLFATTDAFSENYGVAFG